MNLAGDYVPAISLIGVYRRLCKESDMRKSDKNWTSGPEAKKCTVRFLDDGQTSVHTLRVRGDRTARAIIEAMVEHAYELNCALAAEVAFTVGGIELRVDGKRGADEVLDTHYRAAKALISNAWSFSNSASFALEARCALALGRIAMIARNVDVAEMHICYAELFAIESGRLAFHERRDISPFLTGDSILTTRWQIGRDGDDGVYRYAPTDYSMQHH
ncbi:hypothetical protein [Burkholderia stagnalis]|uniref:hypothetical protein n=1 Tax=Burkholderia stagnalis TaxID=1503054 RepID=UPI000F594D04|nr:hypothetical protein [Burkholderia stagnalis]